MCLISVCPKGTSKNSDYVYKFIKSGMDSNKSGSGYMFKRNNDNKITLRKGFFDYDELIASLKNDNLNDNDELVIHHRIPTSGNKNDLNCHPFVISDKHEEVIMTNGETDKPCLAHNGIFRGISRYEALNNDFSDTYAFTRYVMGNKNVFNLFLTDIDLFSALTKDIVGSDKLALLFPNRDLILYGNYIEDDGYFHSNTGYKRYTYDRGGSSTSNNSYSFYESRWNEYDDWRDSEDWPPVRRAVIVPEKKVVSPIKTLPYYLTFDSSEILLNESNYDDFEYIKKSKWDSTSPNERYKINLSVLEGFDIEALLQVLKWKSENGKTYGSAVETIALMNDYYYVPKASKYETYKDYKKLLLNEYKYSKSSIKDLGKTLSNNYMKPDNHPILFKKDGKFYCKKALKMFHENLTNPMKEVLNVLTLGTA